MGLKQKLFAKKIKEKLSVKDGYIAVNIASCDGCRNCITYCPKDAISIREITTEEKKDLPLKGRIKVKIKGPNKAFIDTTRCIVCGICMEQCHEYAIHKYPHE
ncbi:4Fe-4S binding protein [Halosquirtibacter laminarini]|uniref:4Fe-4S binding protein n=1 Tax=Halosquirtibacter laminarini TaxID=3374600 RepID=A0AC61NGN7_9BACT|nr:4Fe-4S binding protein [Prolixibacteraceae bacterium]